MSLTISKRTDILRDSEVYRVSNKRFKTVYLDITFDSSYATGGEALDLRPYFNGSEPSLILAGASLGSKGYRFEYDTANHKLLAYTSGGTQVSDTTNLSTVSVRIRAEGMVKKK